MRRRPAPLRSRGQAQGKPGTGRAIASSGLSPPAGYRLQRAIGAIAIGPSGYRAIGLSAPGEDLAVVDGRAPEQADQILPEPGAEAGDRDYGGRVPACELGFHLPASGHLKERTARPQDVEVHLGGWRDAAVDVGL